MTKSDSMIILKNVFNADEIYEVDKHCELKIMGHEILTVHFIENGLEISKDDNYLIVNFSDISENELKHFIFSIAESLLPYEPFGTLGEWIYGCCVEEINIFAI